MSENENCGNCRNKEKYTLEYPCNGCSVISLGSINHWKPITPAAGEKKEEVVHKWICSDCGEAINSGFHCTLSTDDYSDMPSHCPVCGEECEWREVKQ